MNPEYGWVHTDPGDEPPNLGSCCNCGQQNSMVLNILFIDRKSPEPGEGCWGCLICDLPQAGAVAVLCDDCRTKSEGYPKNVCLGSPEDNRRMLFSELPVEPFQHDVAKHAADEDEAAVPEDSIVMDFAERLADQIVDHVSSEIERNIKRRERHQRN